MKLLLSLILVIYSSVSFSQSAEDVLKSLQNKFDSISDLSVDVSQSSENSGSLSGKMFFKKENKFIHFDLFQVVDGTKNIITLLNRGPHGFKQLVKIIFACHVIFFMNNAGLTCRRSAFIPFSWKYFFLK